MYLKNKVLHPAKYYCYYYVSVAWSTEYRREGHNKVFIKPVKLISLTLEW